MEAASGLQPRQDQDSSSVRTLEQDRWSWYSRYLGSTNPTYDPNWVPSYRERGLNQPGYGTKNETDPDSDPYGKFYGYGY